MKKFNEDNDRFYPDGERSIVFATTCWMLCLVLTSVESRSCSLLDATDMELTVSLDGNFSGNE